MITSNLKDTLQLILLSQYSIREMELFDKDGNLLNKIFKKNQIDSIINRKSLPEKYIPGRKKGEYLLKLHTTGNSMNSVYTCWLNED